MESKGFPVVPLFQIGAIGVELAGGLSILLGFKARWGAVLLFLYLIPVSLVFHDFWAYTGMERNMQMAHFFKNVAIMGGMLLLTAFGPGGYSVDSRVEERQAVAPV
jgi:putative oxidoreductase